MPKSHCAPGENEDSYTQRPLDYGQRARDLLEPIHSKGEAKGDQDGKHSQDNHLQMVRNRTVSPEATIHPG